MPIPLSHRSGGPRTTKGKTAASRNALKYGVATAWIDPSEQERFDDLVARLSVQGCDDPILAVQIEQLATTLVKVERLRRVENALYENARITTEQVTQMRRAISPASSRPDIPEAQALRVATDAAMPDLERLNVLARYQSALDKRMFKLLEEVRILREEAKPRAPAKLIEQRAPARLAALSGEVVDATEVPPRDTERDGG